MFFIRLVSSMIFWKIFSNICFCTFCQLIQFISRGGQDRSPTVLVVFTINHIMTRKLLTWRETWTFNRPSYKRIMRPCPRSRKVADTHPYRWATQRLCDRDHQIQELWRPAGSWVRSSGTACTGSLWSGHQSIARTLVNFL